MPVTRKITINGEEIEISVEEYERLKNEAINSVNYWPTYPLKKDEDDAGK